MTTYIAGYDGSEGAVGALRFATRMAERTGAEVLAAEVYHCSRWTSHDEPGERAGSRRSEGGVTFCAVGGSSPAAGLHWLAEDQDAALIAVGATHRGALGRLVPGSVGERLLHGAPCPVAVVPDGWDGAAFGTIGLAYDGNDDARAALATAEGLARLFGARLVVIAVHEPLFSAVVAPGFPEDAGALDDDVRRRFEGELRELADSITGVRTELRLRSGLAPATLLEAAREGLDMLVMGSRGYGPARAVLLGSVSRHLIDHAPCPIVVLPRCATHGLLSPTVAAERP